VYYIIFLFLHTPLVLTRLLCLLSTLLVLLNCRPCLPVPAPHCLILVHDSVIFMTLCILVACCDARNCTLLCPACFACLPCPHWAICPPTSWTPGRGLFRNKVNSSVSHERTTWPYQLLAPFSPTESEHMGRFLVSSRSRIHGLIVSSRGRAVLGGGCLQPSAPMVLRWSRFRVYHRRAS